jgi:6-phosphogluconolactonase
LTDVRVCADVSDLASRVAEATAAIMTTRVRAVGRCSLALSGGTTPRSLYARWASVFADRIPWADVHVFWGDERFVPIEDRRSNYRTARETLLDLVPCPAANVHAMPTSLGTPEIAAAAYEATLRRYFNDDRPRFDLLLLGLGTDGHTASLFPRSPALDETARWVLPVTAPADPPSRLTLTLPVLNAASHVYVLAAGPDKAAAVARVLSGTADVHRCPAAGLLSHGEGLVWWLDREAAALFRAGG